MSSFSTVVFSIAYIIFWIAFIYLLISFFEYLIHKHFMHQKRFSNKIYLLLPYLIDAFEAHAVRHHAHWYRKFNYESDPIGREENLEILIFDIFAMLVLTLPAWATLMRLNIWYGAIFISAFFIHRFLWNTFHRQMHIPKKVFFRNWKAFRFLARHHFLHHQSTSINFNVVFPGADFMFGSVGVAQFKDIREMLRLGHLAARSDSAKKILIRQGLPVFGANQ